MIRKNGITIESSSSEKSDLTLILTDSTSQIEEIKKVCNMKKVVIVSFDYDSHKMLSNNKIEHEISDNYLNEYDLQNIQKKSYDLSKWFDESKISEIMEYDGINFGQFLHVEFTYFLVKFLKEFLELTVILKKYRGRMIFASPTLYNIVKTMTEQMITKLGTQTDGPTFQFDYIKYNFKIRNHSYTFTIPRRYYIKLKSMSEKILHLLLESNKTMSSNSNTSLLVEFDPIRFKSLFSEMNKIKLNFSLYNRRRPSIWNFESFRIIKNSKCKIITSHSLDNGVIESKIPEGVSTMHSKINSLFDEEKLLARFFIINDISFWNSIKLEFMELVKKRVEEFVTEIEIAKQLLVENKISSVVVWSEVGSTEQIIIKLAKGFNIPIILIQHGIFYDTPEAYDMNVFQGVYPTHVDKYVVWGEVEAANAIKNGVEPDKIEILGSPQYDNTTYLKNKNLKQDFILVVTSALNKEEVRGLMVKTSQQAEETISRICHIVSNINKKLIIKLHPSPDEQDFSILAKKINSNIVVLKAGNITPLIKDCDVVVMIDLTSVVIEAQLCKKPVIHLSVKNWWGTPEAFRSNSCITTDIDDLPDVLNKILCDKEFRSQLINRGTSFVNRYVKNQGTASKKILDLILRLSSVKNS